MQYIRLQIISTVATLIVAAVGLYDGGPPFVVFVMAIAIGNLIAIICTQIRFSKNMRFPWFAIAWHVGGGRWEYWPWHPLSRMITGNDARGGQHERKHGRESSDRHR